MIPSRDKCIDLMKLYHMRPNIMDHSLLVSRIAVTLGRMLRERGLGLDVDLIEAGALLHDITKTRALMTGENHSESGAELLRELGFSQVAEIVGQHVRVKPDVLVRDSLHEAEVVNYADKRVMHDQLVSLKKRFLDIQERYGLTPERRERIRQTEQEAMVIELRIFSRLPIKPQDLKGLINGTH